MCGWPHVAVVRGLLLVGPGPCRHATPAVKAWSVINGGVVDDYGTVNIGVMHNGNVNPAYSGVITKVSTVPSAPIITIPIVSITIVNTAVKAYVRPPITGMVAVKAVVSKGPIIGCPKVA